MSFSLFLLIAIAAGEGEFGSLAQRMRSAPNVDAAIQEAQRVPAVFEDSEIGAQLATAETAAPNEKKAARDRLLAMVELRALTEGPAAAPELSPVAKNIKSSPFYSDAGVKQSNRWLANALERLKNLRFNLNWPKMEEPRGPANMRWLAYVMWGILACGVLVLAYFAFRYLNWKGTLARRAKAVLEEDEPERSLDEWLQKADELAASGAYREAVRALYLACLLRFDEHRVARFDRHQTNWEHLGRIHRSARRPADLDFTPPTKAFDRIWYGQRVNGVEDVDAFREWYRGITEALRKVPS